MFSAPFLQLPSHPQAVRTAPAWLGLQLHDKVVLVLGALDFGGVAGDVAEAEAEDAVGVADDLDEGLEHEADGDVGGCLALAEFRHDGYVPADASALRPVAPLADEGKVDP